MDGARALDAARIQSLAARFGVEYLLVFRRIGPGRDQDFVLQMLEGEPDFLTPVVENEDVALYRMTSP
ncbi:MAG: hypothetical protein HC869_15950 [Rhodospirillales bacterium]|nr:hypothetical protein [Rhodospirillales bacterium]